ncbi:hypothetical protein TWF281_002374 [Arthrobotrys megalospora]
MLRRPKHGNGVKLFEANPLYPRGILNKLPKELLHIIAKNLARDDLARMACTCSTWRDICEPLIYRNAILQVAHPKSALGTPPLFQPYYRLMQSRHLVGHVRHIAVIGPLEQEIYGRAGIRTDSETDTDTYEHLPAILAASLFNRLQPHTLRTFEYDVINAGGLCPISTLASVQKHDTLTSLNIPVPRISKVQFEMEEYEHLYFPKLRKLRITDIKGVVDLLAVSIVLGSGKSTLKDVSLEFHKSAALRLFGMLDTFCGPKLLTSDVLKKLGLSGSLNMRPIMDKLMYSPITKIQCLEVLTLVSGTMRPQLVDYIHTKNTLTTLVLKGNECPRLHHLLKNEADMSLRLKRFCVALCCDDSCAPLALEFALRLDAGLESFQFLDSTKPGLYRESNGRLYVSEEDTGFDEYPEEDPRCWDWWSKSATAFKAIAVDEIGGLTGVGPGEGQEEESDDDDEVQDEDEDEDYEDGEEDEDDEDDFWDDVQSNDEEDTEKDDDDIEDPEVVHRCDSLKFHPGDSEPSSPVSHHCVTIAGCANRRRRLLSRLRVIHIIPSDLKLINNECQTKVVKFLAHHVASQLCTSWDKPVTEWLVISLLEANDPLDYYFRVECTRRPPGLNPWRYSISLTDSSLTEYLAAGMPCGFLDVVLGYEGREPYPRHSSFYDH